MNLEITLSITAKREASHNTFLLRWNPTLSAYSMEQLENDMAKWADGMGRKDFYCEVKEWQEVRVGDRFFMLYVGRQRAGLFAAGRFSASPALGQQASKQEDKSQALRVEFETIIHPERAEIITLEELGSELPHIRWSDEDSGILLEKEDAVRLELMWRDYIGRNKALYLPQAVRNRDYDRRSDIDKAICLAAKAHAADYDLDGNPTILHPLAVGMMGQNDSERVVGFLHDVVEDTSYDFEDLEREGFGAVEIEALRLLTHDKTTPYMTYIKRICQSGNRTALRVKMNDLRHNLARGKAGGHTRCVERHTAALAYIEAYLRAEGEC